MTDPFSLAVGAITIAQVGGLAAKYARDIRSNYRDAEKQIKHAKTQWEMLQSNLGSTYFLSNENCSAGQSSFEAIGHSFPDDLRFDSRRARLRWAAKKKDNVAEVLGQLKETEISMILKLLLDQM
jgi:hypothetical protein